MRNEQLLETNEVRRLCRVGYALYELNDRAGNSAYNPGRPLRLNQDSLTVIDLTGFK